MRFIIIAYLCLCLIACGQSTPNTSSKIIDSVPATVRNNKVITVKKRPDNIQSPVLEKANPLAKHFFNDSFYFSKSDEAGPFGNHDGIDAYIDFYGWRQLHKNERAKLFLSEQLNRTGYPNNFINDTAAAGIIAYVEQNEFGSRLISGTDAIIISLAFSQLYLEGIIDEDIKEMAKKAISRQTIPNLLSMWGEPYRTIRKTKFKKMLAVLNK